MKKKPVKKKTMKKERKKRKKSVKKIARKEKKKDVSKKETNKKNVTKKRTIGKKTIKKNVGRAKSGIKKFDSMIKGGFRRESINLIVGGSGSGKSIFAVQFLIEGIKNKEKVLYITFEEKKEEFYQNMKKFGWNLEELEKSGKFIFLEYSPEKVKMMLDEGGGSIESIVLKEKITRMVIDSITSFSLLFDDKLSKRQANLGLFDIIRKWDTTTLLTVQDDPLDQRSENVSSIEFEADSITLLYYINVKGKRKRYLEILKMRGTNHSKEIREFAIKKGIKIGKKARIKGLIK